MFSPFYDPSWCFCCMFYYQTLVHAIRNLFFILILVWKNQKQRRKTPKRVSKSTFFDALRILLVNQKWWYAETMTGQLIGWYLAGIFIIVKDLVQLFVSTSIVFKFLKGFMHKVTPPWKDGHYPRKKICRRPVLGGGLLYIFWLESRQILTFRWHLTE